MEVDVVEVVEEEVVEVDVVEVVEVEVVGDVDVVEVDEVEDEVREKYAVSEIFPIIVIVAKDDVPV